MLLSMAPPRHRGTFPERPVPESTARLLKKQYLMELKNKRRDGDILEVKSLQTKVRGRPVLHGSTLDGQVIEYIVALRATAVVNTAIVLA